MNLNLGAGRLKRPGYLSLDYDARFAPDVIADLEAPLPFKDSAFERIYARQVLEHITRYVPLMLECHRVLAYGGVLELSVPCFPCRAAVVDPGHVRFFVHESFLMWGNPAYNNVEDFAHAGLYDVEAVTLIRHKYPGETDWAGAYFSEVQATMRKVPTGYWEREEHRKKKPVIFFKQEQKT